MITKRALSLCALMLVSTTFTAHAENIDNKQLVLDFTHLAFEKKHLREAFDRYIAPDYIQHNPQAPDGAEAALQFLEGFQRQFPQASYDIQRIASDGNLVFLHVHARTTPDDRGMAVVDIFRLDNGRIVEHWDVIQPVPEQSVSKHPMF
ncbi:hypothetical protein AOX61_10350 [Pseudomonas aeruginosa]|uniref:nuclear transport factor 2 family protein n=1 Tax=Pseudomonas aeruginosa TaxID=287 RepID=UPI0007075EC9|nr:nuclear transport factor 2 family protein [Pseudomonas aeruginosa]KQK61076.1 hypothetical protein AOX61_10350 [Pseudomonas aeruginosa]KQK66977.1 hypothetical protein AOX62_01740 [Pseudomonas aeruginosa]